MSVLAWNCRGLGSPPVVQTLIEEVKAKKPIFVFLTKTKAGINKMKSIQRKLSLTQGITVPSDRQSGGLAMVWKEGTNVRLKSCSNTHIDVVECGEMGTKLWRATGFYGQSDSSKRHISGKLIKALKKQCDMPWVIFGDFNEITHSDEKLGWPEQDADQMRAFRECLNSCSLTDFGFIGQRFTWCNERLGDQRTLIRLDRMVANEEWRELFPEAKVHHVSMSTSNHCLLALFLRH